MTTVLIQLNGNFCNKIQTKHQDEIINNGEERNVLLELSNENPFRRNSYLMQPLPHKNGNSVMNSDGTNMPKSALPFVLEFNMMEQKYSMLPNFSDTKQK